MITYIDTSVLLKLLVDDEVGSDTARRLWLVSDYVVCAEIGYVEARAALAAARRSGRLSAAGQRTAIVELDALWAQVAIVRVTSSLVREAAKVAEVEGLRGYDAVHLAAAKAAEATVMATADSDLAEASRRRGLAVANPLDPPAGTVGGE